MPCWGPNWLKNDHMASCWQVGWNNKIVKKYFFNTFGSLGLPTSKENWHQSVPRAMKNEAKIWSAPWSFFWWILNLTWIDFGKVLAAELDTSWYQIAPELDHASNPKNEFCLEGFGRLFNELMVDLGSVLGKPGGDHECGFFFLKNWSSDPPMNCPRAFQERPRAPKLRIFLYSWRICDWVLVDLRKLSRGSWIQK